MMESIATASKLFCCFVFVSLVLKCFNEFRSDAKLLALEEVHSIDVWNNNNQGPTQEQTEKQPERNNNEEINAENTNEEIKEENKENNPNPRGVFVLGVYMHCQGCADKIVKYLRGFDGVEQIETDMKNHTVTVKGKKADPKKILERLRKKSNKHVKLISSILREERRKQ